MTLPSLFLSHGAPRLPLTDIDHEVRRVPDVGQRPHVNCKLFLPSSI